MSAVVEFKCVEKFYPSYAHVRGGIKWFLFHLPSALRQLTRGGFQAVNKVTFVINKGESVGIIGRNGAGKSTVLGLIAGVLRPTSGSIKVSCRVTPLLELGAGFHPDLTGRENIVLNGVLLGVPRVEMRKRIPSIIEFSELGNFIDEPIRTYSSGMLMRLGFSVAVHTDPELLLIDEVTAVGDIYFQQKCKDKISEFRSKGVTIILVTHSMEEVKTICSRAIWLDGGRIKADGNPEQVAPAYVADTGVRT